MTILIKLGMIFVLVGIAAFCLTTVAFLGYKELMRQLDREFEKKGDLK